MKRSMQKAINEYHALLKEKGGNFGSFYVSDVNKLKKIATDNGGISFWDTVLSAIGNSLQAGFVIGYKAGLRESKKKQNQKHEDSSKHSKKA